LGQRVDKKQVECTRRFHHDSKFGNCLIVKPGVGKTDGPPANAICRSCKISVCLRSASSIGFREPGSNRIRVALRMSRIAFSAQSFFFVIVPLQGNDESNVSLIQTACLVRLRLTANSGSDPAAFVATRRKSE